MQQCFVNVANIQHSLHLCPGLHANTKIAIFAKNCKNRKWCKEEDKSPTRTRDFCENRDSSRGLVFSTISVLCRICDTINEQLAEKRSFEGHCEILRTMFQPRALSSDIPASRKGVYLFYNPPINFSRRTH